MLSVPSGIRSFSFFSVWVLLQRKSTWTEPVTVLPWASAIFTNSPQSGSSTVSNSLKHLLQATTKILSVPARNGASSSISFSLYLV